MPNASEYTSAKRPSVRPTVATASGRRRDTQKISATANSDSIAISITIGGANKNTARRRGKRV
jgi:hypothetical protein